MIRAAYPLSAILLCLFSQACTATLEGSFTFTQPPRVALVYFSQDTSLAPGEVVINQTNKMFSESLVVGAKGTRLIFRNSDTIQHNIYAEDKPLGISFDSGMANPGADTTQTITWGANEVVRCGCKIHPKMQVWVASLASAHYRIIRFDPVVNAGTPTTTAFTLADVPAGLSTVRIWTNLFPVQEIDLTPSVAKTMEFHRADIVAGKVSLVLQ